MRKIINPVTVKVGEKFFPVFCSVEINAGKLSISGVVAPMSNGDARGGCGQIDMEFKHQNPKHDDKRYTSRELYGVEAENMQLVEPWTLENWYKFLEFWHVYHLNDMQAGCEHQQAAGLTDKTLTIAHYKLNSETSQRQSKIEDDIKQQFKIKTAATLTTEEKNIYNLPYFLEIPAGEDYPEPEHVKKFYAFDKTEEKTAGWLSQEEHPEGELSKPCPVCGYKYGTTWLKKELPAEVVDFLAALPETKKTPAWV
jgi:hypothetical protein